MGGGAGSIETQRYTYDYAKRLASWESASTTPVGQVSERWTYRYSGDGGLQQAQQSDDDGVEVLQEVYSYSKTGYAGPHAPTAIGDATLAYDRSGRVTAKTAGQTTLDIKYNDLDLPLSIALKGDKQLEMTFRYDAFGNQVVRSTSNEKVISVGEIYQRRTFSPTIGDSVVQHTFRVYTDGLVAQETYNEADGTWDKAFVQRDHLGSTALLVNSDGTLRERVAYDPWGAPRSNSSFPDRAFNVGFTGHEHLADFGLIDMGGRFYDPSLRHVLTPDPLASAATNTGIHPYAYAMNNPVNYLDPSGFCTEELTATTLGKNHYTIGVRLCFSDPIEGTIIEDEGESDSRSAAEASQTAAERNQRENQNNRDQGDIDGRRQSSDGRIDVGVKSGVSDGHQAAQTQQKSSFLSSVFGSITIDDVHTGLGAAGFIPGFGALADVVDAGLYVYEGDYVNAGISLIGAVPIYGDAVKGTIKAGKALKAAGEAGVTAVKAAGAAKKATKGGTKLPHLRSTKAGPRLHGDTPHKGDLRSMPTSKLSELRDTTRASLRTRTREMQQLGDKGGHGRRIGQERELLKNIEDALKNRGL